MKRAFLLLFLVLIACNNGRQESTSPARMQNISPPPTTESSYESGSSNQTSSSNKQAKSSSVAFDMQATPSEKSIKPASGMGGAAYKAEEPITPKERKVIYTADVRMQVGNVDTVHRHLYAYLSKVDAYIASDTRTASPSLVENTITIRVRQDGFMLLLDKLTSEAGFVDAKNIRASDVTEEFVDVEARLKNKRVAEQRYQEIMKKAGKISDILEVQSYLNSIREEIEVQQGRLQYLQSQTSYSTITITMYQKQNVEKPVPVEETFSGRFSHALNAGFTGLKVFLLFVFSVWPLWLIGGPLAYGFWQIMRTTEKEHSGTKKKVQEEEQQS